VTSLECKEIFARLSEYLDRELPAGLCDDIEKHIAGCPPCVEFVKSIEKTVQLCREVKLTDGEPKLSDEKLAELKAAYEAHCGR
jgi:RNA polymerase sigma-70 factor (ECF subfamily)